MQWRLVLFWLVAGKYSHNNFTYQQKSPKFLTSCSNLVLYIFIHEKQFLCNPLVSVFLLSYNNGATLVLGPVLLVFCFRCKKIAATVPKMLFISRLSILESSLSAQTSKGFMGLTRNMTLLIAGVGGAFVVILIGIIGVICFVRKIHKNSTPASTPVNSRPTSQQEQAEMASVRQHHILGDLKTRNASDRSWENLINIKSAFLERTILPTIGFLITEIVIGE